MKNEDVLREIEVRIKNNVFRISELQAKNEELESLKDSVEKFIRMNKGGIDE